VRGVPESNLADVAAYIEATKDLKAVHIEEMTVQDPLKVAGTPDRVVEYQGKRYIADLKTGDIEWGAGKIAAQLAMYARSKVYDVATGERTSHGAEIDKGLVIHLPAGSGECTVHWIDLIQGWQTVVCCRMVRERRAVKAKDLYSRFGVDLLHTVAESIETNLERKIRACVTADTVRALWAQHAASWTDALTQVARDHIASLESTTTEGVTA
jgi:hypothetical protein